MLIAIILILVAVALFLILHDDHDDSYTRGDGKPARQAQKSSYQKDVTPKHTAPKPQAAPRPAAPNGQPARKPLDFHFLDRMDYDATLPERTMSSFIAGVQGYCTKEDLGGLVGYVTVDRATSALEVHAGDGRLMGYLPMKDRAAYLAFNPGQIPCPFAGHVGVSTTGRCYADIRIVLPSTRDFVEESLTGFLE